MTTNWLTNSVTPSDSIKTEFMIRCKGQDSLLTAMLIAVENPDLKEQHEQLICEWIRQSNPMLINPQCSWYLAEDHPAQRTYIGRAFYTNYVKQLENTFPYWEQRICDVIGTSIGAIVVGDYRFQRKENGIRYGAPFVHFYRIHQRELISVRYYMGTINPC